MSGTVWRALRHCFAALCLGATAAPILAQGFEPFEFALVGDPQIGYGPGAEYADAARFAQVIEDIVARKFPITVVAGDLVQDRSIWQHWAYGLVAKRLSGQVLLVPGNHDIVDRSSLADWRDRHGPDYHEQVWRNVAFVLLNSETARDSRISSAEYEAQWQFIERSLSAHAAARRTHVVLVMHRPPFVEREDEPESEQNWPPQSRTRLLELARAHGVRLILAGHLHRTSTVQARDGLKIVVGAGSARSFDQSPIAYHRVRVEQAAITVEQVVVAPPPSPPFAVPGLSGWTPRLFDFSVRHWIFSVLYLATSWLAWRAARRCRSAGQADDARLWRVVAFLLVFFAANMQLDFDELISEVGRIAAKLTGIYYIRHAITATSALLIGVGALLLFARHALRRRGRRAPLWALACLAPSTAWFCLSAMSHHDIGTLFNEAWWDLLVICALSVLAVFATRRVPKVDTAADRSAAA